jgi:hypothetical protein
MKELIQQIKLKADSIPNNTETNRRVKGAYVDCLIMVKKASENLVLADVMKSVCVCDFTMKDEHGRYDVCIECGAKYPR